LTPEFVLDVDNLAAELGLRTECWYENPGEEFYFKVLLLRRGGEQLRIPVGPVAGQEWQAVPSSLTYDPQGGYCGYWRDNEQEAWYYTFFAKRVDPRLY
jgi:hypothetical protein